MTENQIIIGLLIASTVISIVYIIINCTKKQYAKGFIKGGFMLITPVFGPMLMLLSSVSSEILNKFRVDYLDTTELSFSKNKNKIILGDDIQRGINKVPIEEALLEADSENVRRVLLDILKNDFESSIPILIKAIDSEDSEVSHYASAAISDVLSKFKRNQKMMEKQIHEERDNLSLLNEYMEYVYRYLNYDIFPESEFYNYFKIYEELMLLKKERFPNNMLPTEISNWITMLVKQEREETAKEWLDYIQQHYSEELESYKARLQYSYRYNRSDFVQCIKDIKKSTIDLDEETVEFVRFFQV